MTKLGRFFTGADIARHARTIVRETRLRTSCPGMFQHAWLITVLNGWSTCRRYQQSGSCTFGCAYRDCALEHYLQCPLVWPIVAACFDPPLGTSLAHRLCIGVPANVFLDHMCGLTMVYRAFCASRFGRRHALDEIVGSALRDILVLTSVRRSHLHISRDITG